MDTPAPGNDRLDALQAELDAINAEIHKIDYTPTGQVRMDITPAQADRLEELRPRAAQVAQEINQIAYDHRELGVWAPVPAKEALPSNEGTNKTNRKETTMHDLIIIPQAVGAIYGKHLTAVEREHVMHDWRGEADSHDGTKKWTIAFAHYDHDTGDMSITGTLRIPRSEPLPQTDAQTLMRCTAVHDDFQAVADTHA